MKMEMPTIRGGGVKFTFKVKAVNFGSTSK